LAAGTKGKRNALPNARVMIHQPLLSGGMEGTTTDIMIYTKELIRTKRRMNELLAKHTGQPIERIEKETDRDNWMTATEAMEYGLVDHVLERLDSKNLPPRPESQ